MKNKKNKSEEPFPSVNTPTPPQVMDPSKAPEPNANKEETKPNVNKEKQKPEKEAKGK